MQSPYLKFLSLALLAILIVGGFYYGLTHDYFGFKSDKTSRDPSTEAPRILVEQSPVVAGIPAIPKGFPVDMPVEVNRVIESTTALYPDQNAKQLSLSYQSDRTVAEKYAEYREYLRVGGYKITEGDPKAAIRSIFGTKTGANISVVISRNTKGTLVQVTYLLTALPD